MYDLLMLPQCKGNNHWVLLVASVMSRTVTIYDSLGGNNKALFDLFCQFMCQRAQIVKDGLEKFSSEFKAPPCNKQRHGNSCGVFALMTAKCLVLKMHPTMLRQAHDSVYRD
ncbi:sentrin-specific protease 1-like [Dreissena polymorpha]|nr:sentrin-specific protease 1-like [Dreissena polymorpha]